MSVTDAIFDTVVKHYYAAEFFTEKILWKLYFVIKKDLIRR